MEGLAGILGKAVAISIAGAHNTKMIVMGQILMVTEFQICLILLGKLGILMKHASTTI